MQLREGAMDNKSQLLAEMMPNSEVYNQPLTIPLAEALDWKSVITHEQGRRGVAALKFYIVVFRSIRSKTADWEKLYAADALAHEEATKSGGLLRYWYGNMNERRECLAMCIWESRDQALAALHLPAHRVAMELARNMYEAYILERYWLTSGPDGNPIFDPLPSSPHGLVRPDALGVSRNSSNPCHDELQNHGSLAQEILLPTLSIKPAYCTQLQPCI